MIDSRLLRGPYQAPFSYGGQVMSNDFKKGFVGFFGGLLAAGCSVGVFFIGHNLWVRYQLHQEMKDLRSTSPYRQCVLREKNKLCPPKVMKNWPGCWTRPLREETEQWCRYKPNQEEVK